MSGEQDGRAPSGQATQASPEAAGASSPSGEYPSREAVKAAIKATEYKYFGDYELSADQREAVDVLVSAAVCYLTIAEGA